jgi:3',5'-cyclic AMP phosphodiesterase CpdA
MRIGICSDIHVHRREQAADVRDLVAYINARQHLDLLICAGDLSHHTEEVGGFLESVTIDCPRVWLPGNHDVWVIDAESEKDTADFRYRVRFPAISEAARWHYLPSGPLNLPGGKFTVVGTMGWFTDTGYSEWFDADAGERDQDLARRFADELEACIHAVDSSARLVVVTHQCPAFIMPAGRGSSSR